jgi:DNA-binding CsgD family transcriptional regulator
MKKLCPTARAICEQLSEGQSINEIANRMGVSWHTVNKHLATIRECFASVGLSELAT